MNAERELVGAWLEFLAHPLARARMAAGYEAMRSSIAEVVEEGVRSGELGALDLVTGEITLRGKIPNH